MDIRELLLHIRAGSSNRQIERDTGVDPGGVQTFVPQKGGHLIQRCARVDQVLGKGVPERVAGAIHEPGLVGVLCDQVVDPGLAEGPALAQKEPLGPVLSPLLEVGRKGLAGPVVQRRPRALLLLLIRPPLYERSQRKQQCLYFLPLPQRHRSLRTTRLGSGPDARAGDVFRLGFCADGSLVDGQHLAIAHQDLARHYHHLGLVPAASIDQVGHDIAHRRFQRR